MYAKYTAVGLSGLFRALHRFIAFLGECKKKQSANMRKIKQNNTHLFGCVFCLLLQLICKSQFAKTQEDMSPFLTCFPRLLSAKPFGWGHTRLSHIKRRRLIVPLVALVQKITAHPQLRTKSGARRSLPRRRCSSHSVFERVSACLSAPCHLKNVKNGY